ncbi:MAG: hypothetical protein JW947_02650, partial [Sedimentisphaerales bacterium]|nr:hypothetical protein [Sedimentisphaerales bacterium]
SQRQNFPRNLIIRVHQHLKKEQKFIWSASKWGPVSQAPGERRRGFRRCSHREETCQSTPKPTKSLGGLGVLGGLKESVEIRG